MKRISQLAAALVFAIVALPLAAQVNDIYVVPAAANQGGNFGTRWMTQLSVFNPQLDYPLKVSITYLPSGGGQGIEVLVNVGANSVLFTDNVLDEVFGLRSGTGALIVAVFPEDNPGVPDAMISRAVLVTTNTFNNASTGTYGQTIPGIWSGLQDYGSDGISAVAHGIRNISRYGWRTNFGAVNLGSTPVALRINVYDANGQSVLKNASYTLPARGHAQWGLPVEVDHGAVEFFVDDPTQQAVVFPYTSTIDQYSGDPTYQSPTLLASTSVLFPKKAMTASTSIGRKLTIDDGRAIRASVRRIGEVSVAAKAEH